MKCLTKVYGESTMKCLTKVYGESTVATSDWKAERRRWSALDSDHCQYMILLLCFVVKRQELPCRDNTSHECQKIPNVVSQVFSHNMLS